MYVSCVTSFELTCGQFRPLGTLSVDIWSAPSFRSFNSHRSFPISVPMTHLRLLMAQCLIYAINRDFGDPGASEFTSRELLDFGHPGPTPLRSVVFLKYFALLQLPARGARKNPSPLSCFKIWGNYQFPGIRVREPSSSPLTHCVPTLGVHGF